MSVPKALQRVIWPRTVRRMLGAILMPWTYARIGRKRVDAVIGSFGLPEGTAATVRETVRRTWLWPEERLDVAQELGAHFADGAAAGRSEEEMLAGFGDARRASRLIRRAKIRNRPLWWRSWKWMVRSAGILTLLVVVAYGWMAGRYFLGSPNIAHNYAAELNAPILATPREERAWPVYVSAVRELGRFPEFYYGRPGEWPTSSADERWAEGVKFLKDHETGLATVRRAAGMRMLGYVYGNTTDPEYMRALEARSNGGFKYLPELEKPEENPTLIGILLPYLGEMRNMARLLRFDARMAAMEGDRARLRADIEAMLGLADQCFGSKFFIDTLVGIAIAQVACDTSMESIGTPGLLTREDLVRVAHRFGTLGNGKITFDAEYERMSFQDLMQRFFTDNGRGDGHLIRTGQSDFYREFGVVDPNLQPFARPLQPIRGALTPSRATLTAKNDRYIAAIAHDDALPLWRHDERTSGREQHDLYGVDLGAVFPFESFMDGGENNNFVKQFAARDLLEAHRWGVMTACALETFRLDKGMYPATLEALVPEYLPMLPVDPFDGKPMRYKVVGDAGDGSAARPLLWSVGVDQRDDGGRGPRNPEDRAQVIDAKKIAWFKGTGGPSPKEAQVKEKERAEGDWVIYPAGGEGKK